MKTPPDKLQNTPPNMLSDTQSHAVALSRGQLTGLDSSHLVALPCGHHLQSDTATAFALLQADARVAGFELAIASSFRSFERQLAIFNGKARGERAVHDDSGCAVCMEDLSPSQQLQAIMRYSALPGSSRHHWGTDLDVYDAAALPRGCAVQLMPAEVAADGIFDPLHCWLDARMATAESHGFYRPYATDHQGVAPERWHLSYAPVSMACAGQLDGEVLRWCWRSDAAKEGLLLRREIEQNLEQLLQRYVAVADDWWQPG